MSSTRYHFGEETTLSAGSDCSRSRFGRKGIHDIITRARQTALNPESKYERAKKTVEEKKPKIFRKKKKCFCASRRRRSLDVTRRVQ